MDQPTGEMAEPTHLITSLQSQLQSLRLRVEELESDNARLSSLVSNCCCHKAEENIDAPVAGSVGLVDGKGSLNSNVGKSRKKKENLTVPDDKVGTGHQYSRRYVALKVMYFGQRFFGFGAAAAVGPPVVEEPGVRDRGVEVRRKVIAASRDGGEGEAGDGAALAPEGFDLGGAKGTGGLGGVNRGAPEDLVGHPVADAGESLLHE